VLGAVPADQPGVAVVAEHGGVAPNQLLGAGQRDQRPYPTIGGACSVDVRPWVGGEHGQEALDRPEATGGYTLDDVQARKREQRFIQPLRVRVAADPVDGFGGLAQHRQPFRVQGRGHELIGEQAVQERSSLFECPALASASASETCPPTGGTGEDTMAASTPASASLVRSRSVSSHHAYTAARTTALSLPAAVPTPSVSASRVSTRSRSPAISARAPDTTEHRAHGLGEPSRRRLGIGNQRLRAAMVQPRPKLPGSNQRRSLRGERLTDHLPPRPQRRRRWQPPTGRRRDLVTRPLGPRRDLLAQSGLADPRLTRHDDEPALPVVERAQRGVDRSAVSD
jgi:hypothetical protein